MVLETCAAKDSYVRVVKNERDINIHDIVSERSGGDCVRMMSNALKENGVKSNW